jgi:hypothetical protein
MKRLFAAIFALPLLLGAGVALADSVEGTVEKVDPSSMSVWVNGQPYQIEQQAAGLKLDPPPILARSGVPHVVRGLPRQPGGGGEVRVIGPALFCPGGGVSAAGGRAAG